MTAEVIDQFRAAIAAAGLTPPDAIEPDGALHRFSPTGKRGDDAGAYVLHADGIPAGWFCDWRSGHSENWRASGRDYSPEEERTHRARVAAMRREREAEEARRHAEAAERAAKLWTEAKLADPAHPYLVRKGIKPHGIRQAGDLLLVPVRIGGKLRSLQTIPADGGEKRFLPGGEVRGGYYSLGGKPGGTLLICEGFATGASLHEATGHPVAVAFSAGNLDPVALALRGKYPGVRLIVCCDDDEATPGNPGVTKGTAAAQAVGGAIAVPDFGADRPEGVTDFNDLAQCRGADAVRAAVEQAAPPPTVAGVATVAVANARGPNSASPDTEGAEWPPPLPLTARIEPEPYPVDALPDRIGAAIAEVQGFVQAPVPLVACSALSAVSVATQALADVRRADRLQGPVGLFLLSIADSGERKTTLDGFFGAAIREWEKATAAAAEPDQRKYRADLSAWDEKRKALLELIRRDAKKGSTTGTKEAELRELEAAKPEPPRVPRLLLGDETPESLAHRLAFGWPSAGIVSSEAGIVFGAHGMQRETIMRNLALLNVLWDGGSLSVGRRTADTFTVRGARLTVALQAQEATLREFFEASRGLARGTGFLARFLIAWPGSTQGSRSFREPPPNWPALAAFNRRVAALLERPPPVTETGELAPQVLELASGARAAWVAFHDAVERELRDGGDLADVKDVASKAADNAARLAALLHVFEEGLGPVSLPAFESASRIVAWHLSEARRFFGELALPAELATAARLDSWLLNYCRRERVASVPRREAQRLGPVREKATLDAALRELDELGRVRLIIEGRAKTVAVNPALLSEGDAP